MVLVVCLSAGGGDEKPHTAGETVETAQIRVVFQACLAVSDGTIT